MTSIPGSESPKKSAVGSRDLSVLVVCAVNGRGGPIHSMDTVLRSEAASGVRAWIATQPPSGDPDENIVSLGERFMPMVRPRGSNLLRAQAGLLRRAVSIRRNIDLIHANGLTEAVVVLPLALVTGLPVVVWIHNSERPRAFAPLERAFRRLIDRWTFVGVSTLAAEQVVPHHCEIIPNPIEREAILAPRLPSASFRVAFLAGTDRPVKGFDLLPGIIEQSSHPGIEWNLFTSPPFSSPDPACRRGMGASAVARIGLGAHSAEGRGCPKSVRGRRPR